MVQLDQAIGVNCEARKCMYKIPSSTSLAHFNMNRVLHHIVLAILCHVIPAIPFSRACHPESDERVWIFSPEVRLELFHPTFQGRYFTHLTIEIVSC